MRKNIVKYIRCDKCDSLILRDTAKEYDDKYYCDECYAVIAIKEIIEEEDNRDLTFMKKRTSITREELKAVKGAVLKHYGYYDEFVESDILFIIEYILGFKEEYIPDEYMIDIIKKIFY